MWHSSLTKENIEDLERVQKAALKVILKDDYLNYKDALKLTKMESLHERREIIALRFAKNCLKNENYSKLFPLKNHKHEMTVRNPLKYKVKKANTERLKVSTIPYMQRVLNDDFKKRKKKRFDLTNELNKSKITGCFLIVLFCVCSEVKITLT